MSNSQKINQLILESSRRKFKEFKEDQSQNLLVDLQKKIDEGDLKNESDAKASEQEKPAPANGSNLTTQKAINNFFKSTSAEPKSSISNFLGQKPLKASSKPIYVQCDWKEGDTYALIDHFKLMAAQDREQTKPKECLKNIDIHDSYISYNKARWEIALKEMLSITQNNSEFTMRPRNPFKTIEPFDYERDSEEEFNDMNGENLMSDGLESDLDEYDQSLVEEGFIVDDNDYETFSDSEQEGINLLKQEN